ncbi:expressed unknown protein [Ectocarpus siliculosus]|uniref:Uncharacterized protein n=1 Tax=Ectocarpus siliculosus TaxID=2880 RepID=D7FK98_ECTSI|nr:expressed unknown protein [Ectocarpus siliculosus]|eukprot:CBJ29303.1 expressed unknown protein [Ectocarpus siliculosus]
MCWDGLSSLWVFGGQGAATSKADSSRTHQGVKIRTLARRTCFNDFFEFDTKRLVAGPRPGGSLPHLEAWAHCDPRSRAATRDLNLGNDGASGYRRADSESVGHGNSTPRSPGRITPRKRSGEGEGGRRGAGGGGDSSGGGGGKESGDGGMGRASCESREMFVIGGAGTDPIRNMEVVYPQLWIFDFNRRTWTCVEAAGGGGASGGGRSKGNNNSSAAAGPGPPAVFDHTATLAGGTHIVVIGGVMVGRALNSQVYMLALDTLQWSTLEPHPLGFSAPAIHGHTAVEDPAHAGRLIIFGGRGGKSWNTQVLTFQFRKNLWSMAVCDMAEPPPDELNANQTSAARGKRSSASPLRVTILDNPVIGRTEPSRGGSDEPKAAPAPPSPNNTDDERPQHEPLGEPGQQAKRHGHTCFVWDPRQAALACNDGGGGAGGAEAGDGGDGDGARGLPVSPKRGSQNRGSGRSNGGAGGGASRKSSPKRPRGDNSNTTPPPSSRKGVGGGGGGGGGGGRSGGGGGGRSRNRRTPTPSSPTDESLPHPCIVTFGGSALRTGGGYARAALHVLETPAPEDNDSDNDGGGRKASSPSTGILASLELAADAPKQTFNKFQSFTNSVLLKVHSLRQLGNEQLTFGDSYNPEDLSYIDLKVQSVVLGVGGRTLEADGSDEDRNSKTSPAATTAGGSKAKTRADVKPPHPGAGRLGSFPTGYEQARVKAFLADARPANARIRPVSAPAHLVEPGGGSGGILDKGRKAAGGRRWNEHERRRRPGTAGAALGSGVRRGDHHHERSSLPPMMPSTHAASDSSRLARPNSRVATASGGRHLHHQRVVGGGGGSSSVNSSTAGGGVGDNNHASTGGGGASLGGTTAGGLGGSLTLGGRGGGTPTLFYHRSVPGGAPGGRAGGGGGAGNLGRVPMLGSRPLLVPKPTMAAHNGRLLMEHEWADAGFFY